MVQLYKLSVSCCITYASTPASAVASTLIDSNLHATGTATTGQTVVTSKQAIDLAKQNNDLASVSNRFSSSELGLLPCTQFLQAENIAIGISIAIDITAVINRNAEAIRKYSTKNRKD